MAASRSPGAPRSPRARTLPTDPTRTTTDSSSPPAGSPLPAIGSAARLHHATRGDAGRRLDLVLRRHLSDIPAATRTAIQRWIETGRVTVDNMPVRRVAARVAVGAVMAVRLPDLPAARAMQAEDMPLTILYEDAHLLIVDKPAGLVAHPSRGYPSGTLMNGLLALARHWPAPLRPSLLTRLDRQTSGLVVVAKSAAAHAALQRTLRAGSSKKEYLAVVHGRVPVTHGDIDLRLRRDPGDRRRVVASAIVGEISLTRVSRVARTKAGAGADLSLLRCELVTGRTHQIRVHLAARGWPIVGDEVYGRVQRRGRSTEMMRSLRAFPRQALHAWRVAFVHPVTGCLLTVQAPLPSDLHDLLDLTRLLPAWQKVPGPDHPPAQSRARAPR
ncbi:MAG: RluA family pseudouridine synthase [Vicinamibacterales bacterium]